MKSTSLTSWASVFLLSVIAASPAVRAQSTPNQISPNNTTGTSPYATYGGTHENIDLATGNVNIQIPLLSLPGRNKLDLNLGITYDSKMWVLNYNVDPFTGAFTYLWENQPSAPYLDNSWRFNLPVLQTTQVDLGADGSFTDSGCWSSFVVTMPDGDKHMFRNQAGCWGYNPSSGTVSAPTLNHPLWDAQDTSLMRLDTTNPADIVLHLKSGTQIHFFSNLAFNANALSVKVADKIEDTDGNTITITSTSSTAIPGSSYVNSITDTVGRVVTFHYTGSSIVPASISYLDSSGTTRSISFAYTTPSCTPTYSLPAGSLQIGTCNSLTSVTLPNNLSYNFTYNSTLGELSKITYPTGGYTRYDFATYTNIQEFSTPLDATATTAEDFREISARHVCRSSTGSCASEDTTTYTATIAGSKANNSFMDVVDTFGNLTHVQFTQGDANIGSLPRETNRSLYNGPTTSSTLLRTIQTDYNSTIVNDDILPIRVTTTLNDTNQVSKVEFDYDSYNASAFGGPVSEPIDNVIEKREFAYGSGTFGALVRKTDYTWLKTNAVNGADYTTTAIHILDRKATEKTYDGSSTLMAQSQFEYDRYDTSTNHATLLSSGAVQHDTAFGTTYSTRGNVTSAQHWRNTDGAWLAAVSQYDDSGNILKSIDPGNHATALGHADSWSNASCAPVGGSAAAFVTSVTNALSQTSSAKFNSCTGTNGSATDANSQMISSTYDLMGRMIQTNLPDTGQVSRAFNELSMPLSVTPSAKITSGSNMVTSVIVDGLGRVSQSQLTSDPQGITYTDTTYDSEGRKKTVSNPYRSTSDPTYGITTYNYDALGRVIQVIPPDGTATANNVATSYSGNCTTVTDQTGKSRKTCVDALGRLIQVFEDPAGLNLETDYAYDTLNNLLTVNQKGGSAISGNWRARTFTYNSLSQLLSASNPESGTITYAYDADGNLITKTAPAPNQTGSATVTTTYTYDVLHRLTQKSYSDGVTPAAVYVYDSSTAWGISLQNTKGRLASESSGSTGSIFSYDSMGRVIINNQCTPSVCGTSAWLFSYSYDLAGDMLTASNGVGVTFSYTYDTASRPTGMTSSLVDANHPATLATVSGYFPTGAPSKVTYGNGLTETEAFNNRLQPCRYNVNSSATALAACTDAIPTGSLQDYNYGFNAGTANNGNIASMTGTGNQAFARTYGYDSLNRLWIMADSATGQPCKGLSWTYDPWGNRTDQTVTAGSCGAFHASVDTNNRLTGAPYQYDAAGNMTHDASHSYTYDAENRLIQVDGGATASYVYDAAGRRVRKNVPGISIEYLYNADGSVASEQMISSSFTGWSTGYVYFGGGLASEYYAGTTYFVHKDHLGSTRLMSVYPAPVNPTSSSQWFFDSMDYLPFGEQIAGASASTHKFTSKERDGESGLDDFGARYFSSAMGRFTIPDWAANATNVPYANFGNPQTLNLYTYVKNNPMNLTDPTGHQSEGQLVGVAGNYMAARMHAYGNPAGLPGEAIEPGVWEVTVNGETQFALGDTAEQAAANAAAQNQPALVPLSSDVHYTVASNGPNAPEVHPVFAPEVAARLNAAIAELNKLGIVPQINSAFRTDSDQAYMQSGGSGTNPAAKVSWHQAGGAVDINGTRSTQFKTIVSVMKKNGFVWGGNFKSQKDPPHFDGRQFMGNLNQAVRKAQSYWDSTN